MEHRQDINKLIESAVAVWRNEGRDAKDSNSDFYNLHNDPVTRLLMGAVAYQSDVISEDISAYKGDIVEELVNLCAPEYLLQPVPAVGMIQTGKVHKVDVVDEAPTVLDTDMTFTVSTTDRNKFSFSPLLSVNVYDLKVQSVNPSGRNRWIVELEECESVADLIGLTIYLPNVCCDRILLHFGATTVDVCNIGDFERLPFLPSIMSCSRHSKNTMQLATLQNLYDRLCLCSNCYCIVDRSIPSKMIPRQNGCLQLEIELCGVQGNVNLAKDDILLNCVPVCNVETHKVSLSQDRPLQNITMKEHEGFLSVSSCTNPEGLAESVSVRQVGTNRMTPSAWIQRLQRLLDYYDSEYCLLQKTFDPRFDNLLQQFIVALRDAVKRGVTVDNSMYLVLRDRMIPSLGVTWFSTFGSLANNIAPKTKVEVSSAQLDAQHTEFVSYTMGGSDVVDNRECRHEALRYYLQLRDRIVSKADIIAFCRYKLAEVFSVRADGVKDIRIENDLLNTAEGFKERILSVVIVLEPSVSIPPNAAHALERMIQSRTAHTMPIRVLIQLSE